MGETHILRKKPSQIFASEREIPHIRLGDESVLESRYLREEKLGQGTFGIVYKGTNLESKEISAIKVVNRDKAGSAGIKLLEREIAILKTVSHEHIIRLHEVYETQHKIFLIMEYCDRGELSELLRSSRQMTETTVKIILKRLAGAIAYLHINGIVHRDLKLENILVCTNPADPSDEFFIKVTDFGLSVIKGGMGPENMLQSFCGTPAYMAPEIILNKSYSESCDNWAIGCITFALLTGQLPFWSKDDEKLYDAIKHHEPEWQTLPKHSSADAKQCLQKLLSKDPASRMTAGELVRHPWITGEAGSATPNVLDLMHDFLQQNIQDEEDGIAEEELPNESNANHSKENEAKFTSTGSRSSSSHVGSPGSSSGGIRLDIDRTSSNDLVHVESASNSRQASSSKSSATMKKSPSDHDFESTTSQKHGDSNKKPNGFDISLPASGARNMFSNSTRNQSAATLSTPRQAAPARSPLPKGHANSSANSTSTKLPASGSSNGNLSSTKSKKS